MVLRWCVSLGYGTKKITGEEGNLFHFQVQTQANIVVEIIQTKDLIQYLVFLMKISASQDEADAVAKLSEERANRLVIKMQMELAKHGVVYTGLKRPLREVLIIHRVPITPNLTDYEFSQGVQRVVNGGVIARGIWNVAMTDQD
jgi:hypothetical protein